MTSPCVKWKRWQVDRTSDVIPGADRGGEAGLDIFWLKDDSLAGSDNLPPPEGLAHVFVDDLEAAPEQFRLIAGDLGGASSEAAG